MQLKDSVKQTLLDITSGVTEAQQEAFLHIAPGTVEGRVMTEPQIVKFDVSVTTSAEAGGGISVWSALSAKAGASAENTNRISFEVPVYLQAPTAKNPRRSMPAEKGGYPDDRDYSIDPGPS